ncbi:MAG: TraC family protein [Candidatus Paceibacterota bacterium]
MAKKQSTSTQQFVDIEDIRDGVIILKNNSLRRVLMVAGINFELKSEEEQNIITYTYQNFLNTLDFSVQFIIHSRKLNIDGYLEKLAERKNQESNELLKNQISEYIEFIRSFVEQNAVMAKTFFAVVPYDPIQILAGGKKFLNMFKLGKKIKSSQPEQTLEQKTQQLNHRTDQVINGLTQIGLRIVPLNNEELIELFYNLYNPSAVEKKELKIASA